MSSVKKITKPKEERKIFYFHDEQDKPILAGGILFITDNPKQILIQKISKDNGFQYADFGGKTDLTDETIFDTIARELGEEINYGIYNKPDKIYLDESSLKEILLSQLLKEFYIPTAKYLLLFVNFDTDKFGLNMKIIGKKENLDNIERTVEWITTDTFIHSHFEHHLHPRLWGRNILEFLGYTGPHKDEEIFVKKLTKFAFQ